MRFEVHSHGGWWQLMDTARNWRVLLMVRIDFPDAELLINSQAAFMNESPAFKEAA